MTSSASPAVSGVAGVWPGARWALTSPPRRRPWPVGPWRGPGREYRVGADRAPSVSGRAGAGGGGASVHLGQSGPVPGRDPHLLRGRPGRPVLAPAVRTCPARLGDAPSWAAGHRVARGRRRPRLVLAFPT